ncbi:hypothetical protein MXB_3724, partial [Myxobolus squamalis]
MLTHGKKIPIISKPLYDKFFNFSTDKSRLESVLKEQKLRRETLVNKLRKLDKIRDTPVTNVCEPSMNTELMFSQPTSTIPQPSNDWIIVTIPVGIRCLVISKLGSTKVYDDLGRRIRLMYTCLPGGGITSKN